MYTSFYIPWSIENVYQKVGKFLKGSYFTGHKPPIDPGFNPFTAVIDMETMEVLGVDTMKDSLGLEGVLDLVHKANED
ncbi:MAG: hypothetical protein GY847_34060 [Proteobacteria bacterium]|nr:hypothetical protein [Pseudomonadota bacterium]